MLSRTGLILSAGTVGNPSLPDLLAAAIAGSYTSFAVWPADYSRWRDEGISDADAACRIADRGLSVSQVDCLLKWSAGPELAIAEEESVFAAATALGADCVSAIGPATDSHSVSELAAMLAGVCDRGAERGLNIALEVAPWKGNVDLGAAVRIMEETDRPNARLVIDSWHLFRSATPMLELAKLPGRFVASIQISDAPERATGELVAETMGARLLPGAGELDLPAFVRALDAEVDGVALTVEVLSDELRQAGPIAAAKRAADATRSLLRDIDRF